MGRLIQYEFGPPRPPTGHSLGINALAVDRQLGVLYSAGRDGRVCAWITPDKGPASGIKAVDLHSDWVNDVGIVADVGKVVSCSSDSTVKLWDPKSDNVTTLGSHSDYAKQLASPVRNTGWVASAGLDGVLVGWDIASPNTPSFKYVVVGEKHSIYSLATDRNGTILASGGPDTLIRLWDPRMKTSVAFLKGHTDTVRSILIRDNLLLSASSDNTIKLWSLETRHIVNTWTSHEDSVWSLYSSSSNFSTFYSGDRSGVVLRTQAQVIEAPEVVCRCSHIVQSIAKTSEGTIWTATDKPELMRWIERKNNNANPPSRPVQILGGHCAFRMHRLLNNKRMLLVLDTDNVISMVDLIGMKRVDNFEHKLPQGANPEDELDKIQAAVNTMESLENWCCVQIKAGRVCVSLGDKFGSTEVYVDELKDLPYVNAGSVNDQSRVNLGLWILANCLGPILDCSIAEYHQNTRMREELDGINQPELDTSDNSTEIGSDFVRGNHSLSEIDFEKRNRFKQMFRFGRKEEFGHASGNMKCKSVSLGSIGIKREQSITPETEKYHESYRDSTSRNNPHVENFQSVLDNCIKSRKLDPPDLIGVTRCKPPPNTRINIVDQAPEAGVPTAIVSATYEELGHENTLDIFKKSLPNWVGEALLRSRVPQRESSRVGFVIVPGPQGLKSGPTKLRLAANGILRANKIKQYVLTQLRKSCVEIDDTADAKDCIFLKCRDINIDANMTLCTLRNRIWKNSGDVVLEYGFVQPSFQNSSNVCEAENIDDSHESVKETTYERCSKSRKNSDAFGISVARTLSCNSAISPRTSIQAPDVDLSSSSEVSPETNKAHLNDDQSKLDKVSEIDVTPIFKTPMSFGKVFSPSQCQPASFIDMEAESHMNKKPSSYDQFAVLQRGFTEPVISNTIDKNKNANLNSPLLGEQSSLRQLAPGSLVPSSPPFLFSDCHEIDNYAQLSGGSKKSDFTLTSLSGTDDRDRFTGDISVPISEISLTAQDPTTRYCLGVSSQIAQAVTSSTASSRLSQPSTVTVAPGPLPTSRRISLAASLVKSESMPSISKENDTTIAMS